MQIITTHREALRDYFILETIEAGLVLEGCEVKSLRLKSANLAGSFARFDGPSLNIYNLYIAPYPMSRDNPEPLRPRKLLLHYSQMLRLKTKTAEKGQLLIPIKLYFSDRGIAKVELALAKGKKQHDKRSDIKKDAVKREIDRAIKNRNQK